MSAVDRYIVITSINRPSEAIFEFRKWPGWHVIVVGDRKSPADWQCEGVTYLGIEEQYDRFGALARAIPENTYCRKMLGYVYAMRQGATAIFESDDDNIPYYDAADCVQRYLMEDRGTVTQSLASPSGWTNIYRHFGAPGCWPRGFPLERVQDQADTIRQAPNAKPWTVMQFLADQDPDVDAVYRLTNAATIHFARGRRYLLEEGTFCPMNSQATLWLPEAFPLMFLPLGVADRVTDILRGYIALACLWKTGSTLGYSSPIVYQERNAHNLLRDFKEEIPLYLHADAWRRLLSQVEGTDTVACYRAALNALAAAAAVPESSISSYMSFIEAAGSTATRTVRQAA